MEVFGGIAILAVAIGIGALVTYLRGQASKALTRGILERGNHARGQQATKETIEFAAPVSAETVVEAVRSRLALPTAAPGAFVAQLYLESEGPGLLVFAFGNKISQSFRSALTAEDLAEGGSKSAYTVLNWVEGDGIVRGIPEMELLANTIRTVSAEFGAVYGGAVTLPALAPVPAADATTATCSNCGSEQLGSRFCTDCGAVLA